MLSPRRNNANVTPRSRRTKLNVALSGKISSTLTKLVLAREKTNEITKALQHNVNLLDIIPICMLGWIVQPLCKFTYLKVSQRIKALDLYEKSLICSITNVLSQIGKIAFIVYLFDVLDIILTEIGFLFAKKYEFSTIVAKVCYTVWAAIRLKEYKFQILQKKKQNNPRYPLIITNRALNLIMHIISGLILIDTLQIDMGVTISSVFAFGG